MLTIFVVGVGGVGWTCRKCDFNVLRNSEGTWHRTSQRWGEEFPR